MGGLELVEGVKKQVEGPEEVRNQMEGAEGVKKQA